MKRTMLFCGAIVWISAAVAAIRQAVPVEDDVGGLPPGVQYRKYESVTWKIFNDSAPALERLGTLKTRRSDEIESSDFSVGCECLDRDYQDFEMYKSFLPDLGVKWVRLLSGWAKTERTKGIYDFAWTDAQVDFCLSHRIQPWFCLCYGNPLYSSGKWLGMKIHELVASPEGYTAWLRYVEATVVHYRTRVRRWEIWNEPFDQTEDYAKLCADTAEAIVRAQPEAELVVAACRFPKDHEAVYAALKSKGLEKSVKFWAYHGYSPNVDGSYEGKRRGRHTPTEVFRAWVKGKDPGYDVLQGESGCPAQLEFAHAMSNLPWTEFSKAKWDLRRAIGDRARGIFTSHFSIADNAYPNMLQSFGLIRSDIQHRFIYRRPSYYGMRNVYSFFDATVKSAGVGVVATKGRKATVCRFVKRGRKLLVAWFSHERPTDELEWVGAAVPCEDMHFDKPVWVDLITGGVYALPKDFAEIPLRDSPVMVADLVSVELIRHDFDNLGE